MIAFILGVICGLVLAVVLLMVALYGIGTALFTPK